MSYATKFNKGSRFNFTTSPDAVYVSLEDLYAKSPDDTYNVKSLYINKKSKFGDAPCVVVDKLVIVNLPKYLLATVSDMISDPECVAAINNGDVNFRVYQYQEQTFNKTCYGVEWL